MNQSAYSRNARRCHEVEYDLSTWVREKAGHLSRIISMAVRSFVRRSENEVQIVLACRHMPNYTQNLIDHTMAQQNSDGTGDSTQEWRDFKNNSNQEVYARFKFATSSSFVVPLLRQAILSLPCPFYNSEITPNMAQLCSPILDDWRRLFCLIVMRGGELMEQKKKTGAILVGVARALCTSVRFVINLHFTVLSVQYDS